MNVQELKLETYKLSIRVFDYNQDPEPALSAIGIEALGSIPTIKLRMLSSVGATSTLAIISTSQSTLADIENSVQLGFIDIVH